jgi:DNA-binding GntR family transcriptional regulator
VRRAERALNRLAGFTEDMRTLGYATTCKELDRGDLEPPDRVREQLELDQGAHAVVLERLRLLDDEPVVLQRVWLPFSLVPELARRSLEGSSLYEMLEQGLRIRLTSARQRISAIAATEREADILDVLVGQPLLYVERLTRDDNNRPVEYAESWSMPKLPLWVELHR